MKSIKFLLISLFMLFASNVFAQTAGGTLTIKDEAGNTDFTVAPGEEFNMLFWLSTEYSGFTRGNLIANIYMPEGIEIVGAKEGTGAPALVGLFEGASSNLMYNYRDDFVNVSVTPGSLAAYNSLMDPGEGYIISIKCKVTTATASEEPYIVEVKEPSLYDNEDEDDDFYFPDFTVKIYVKEASAETVEIALGNASGYNTYVSEKDLDFTGLDAKAYIVSAVSSTEATLKAVTTIKAGEGFIIEGAGEGTIEVPVAAETPAASGTLLATGQPSKGDYLLAKDGSSFVLWDGTGTLAATKAYLPASAISSGAKIINIAFGESTGISEVKKSEADGAIYNLSGMRVSKTQKGVYIMNGRKVIVK